MNWQLFPDYGGKEHCTVSMNPFITERGAMPGAQAGIFYDRNESVFIDDSLQSNTYVI